MAKKKGHSRHSLGGFTIPLAPVAGAYVGLLIRYGTNSPIETALAGNIPLALEELAERITCFDRNGFRGDMVLRSYGPIFLGLLLHKVLAPLNRMLGRAKIPFIRF